MWRPHLSLSLCVCCAEKKGTWFCGPKCAGQQQRIAVCQSTNLEPTAKELTGFRKLCFLPHNNKEGGQVLDFALFSILVLINCCPM